MFDNDFHSGPRIYSNRHHKQSFPGIHSTDYTTWRTVSVFRSKLLFSQPFSLLSRKTSHHLDKTDDRKLFLISILNTQVSHSLLGTFDFTTKLSIPVYSERSHQTAKIRICKVCNISERTATEKQFKSLRTVLKRNHVKILKKKLIPWFDMNTLGQQEKWTRCPREFSMTIERGIHYSTRQENLRYALRYTDSQWNGQNLRSWLKKISAEVAFFKNFSPLTWS